MRLFFNELELPELGAEVERDVVATLKSQGVYKFLTEGQGLNYRYEAYFNERFGVQAGDVYNCQRKTVIPQPPIMEPCIPCFGAPDSLLRNGGDGMSSA